MVKKVGFIDIYDLETDDSEKTIVGFKYHLYIFQESVDNYETIEIIETPEAIHFKKLKECYISLPIELLNFRILEFPFSEREKLEKVIPFELSNLILSGSDNIVFDFKILNSAKGSYRILVIYIEKNNLSFILSKFSSFGVDPYVITSIEAGKILREETDRFAFSLVSFVKPVKEERIDFAIQELKCPTFNLRTGDFKYTKNIENLFKKIKPTLILLIILLLVVNLIFGLRIYATSKETSSIKHQIRDIYSSMFPEEKRIVDELYQMKSHLKNIRDKANILIGVAPLEHLSKMSEKKMKGILIEELNIEKEFLTIKGEAHSLENLDEFKKTLDEKYQDVSISETKRVSDNKILFTILVKDKLL